MQARRRPRKRRPLRVVTKKRRLETAVVNQPEQLRLLLLFRRCRLLRQLLKGQTEQFSDAGILFLSILLQHCPLVRRDAHRDLTVRNRSRLAAFEVEVIHGKADNFTGRLKAVTVSSRFDLGDQSNWEIKRQWGGAFLCASGHNSKAASGSRSSARTSPHTDRRCGQRKFHGIAIFSAI